MMIEGTHAGFYYVYSDVTIEVYSAKGVDPALKAYPVGANLEEGKVHMLALGRIRLDLEELHKRDLAAQA